MAITLKEFLILKEDASSLKAAISSMGYSNIKDMSSRSFAIYVPAKDRLSVAQKLADKLGGKLSVTGASAGKPIVEFGVGLKVFVKPKPGAGRGGTAKEDAQLSSLQKQIESELAENDLMELSIKIDRVYYNVAKAVTTPGTPKSDFHLLNFEDDEVVWISHKDGSKAKDFQQWGGMSERAEANIANHIESKNFIADVKSRFGTVMPVATTVSRKISSPKLAGMSIYGNKFGGALGRQNVTILLQGPVKLVKKMGYYELTSNHTSVNGDIMTGGYAAVFMAIYKGDRSNFGIKGARFAIQPEDSRKSEKI